MHKALSVCVPVQDRKGVCVPSLLGVSSVMKTGSKVSHETSGWFTGWDPARPKLPLQCFFEGGSQLIPTTSNPIPAWLSGGETDVLIGWTCLIKDCYILQEKYRYVVCIRLPNQQYHVHVKAQTLDLDLYETIRTEARRQS